MSSSSVGVQAHIKRVAPDADYQGCCLHSLNLVICKSSQITAIRNMFDSCQQAYLFSITLPNDKDFWNTLLAVSAQLPRRQKSMVCARRDGLRGIQLLTQFWNFTPILLKPGMRYVTQAIVTNFILMEATGNGIQKHELLQMA